MGFKVCVFLMVALSESTVFAARQQRDCSIDVLSGDADKLSPILLYNHTSHFEFIVPDEGMIKLGHGERITIACTGNRNYLTATNSNSTYVACIEGDAFKVVSRNIQFDDLKCKKNIRGDIQKTSKKCGNNKGRVINIGYQITRTHWLTLIKVCYDEFVGDTLYTEHTLYGEAIKYASKSPRKRPSFGTEGLGPDIAASVVYKQAFQKSTFNKLLGSSQLAGLTIQGYSYLARGHLSPTADFLYTALQSTTYYYINASPQWQVINGGNWKSLEMAVRKTAERYSYTFRIITGTYDVLSLNDVNNNERQIFLVSGDKLPVPKYIWKIVYDENSKTGIALIVLNNPFVSRIEPSDLLCENICDLYRWGSNSWTDVRRGYVYCCDLNEFLNVVDSAPALEVNGVLRGP